MVRRDLENAARRPELREALGIYYTPTYIVREILRRTLDRCLKGKTPAQVSGVSGAALSGGAGRASTTRAPLRIVDPACGAGAFLIEAYRSLLAWYRDAYIADGPEKHICGDPPRLYLAGSRRYLLTPEERRRILLDHIFGVDIDASAIEAAKISLLRELGSGEAALPDLGGTIKHGNSLIGPDFFDGASRTDVGADAGARLAINAFDWRAEFRSVFASGGFDVTVGNPPYVLMQGKLRDDQRLDYFRRRFRAAAYKIDMYSLFIERAIEITKPGGLVSMITPSNFLTNNHAAALRRLLLNETQLERVIVIDGRIFEGIAVDNAIFIARPGGATAKTFVLQRASADGARLIEGASSSVDARAALADPCALFTGSSSISALNLWAKAQSGSVTLGEIAHVNFGKQLRSRAHFPDDVISVDEPEVRPPYRPCYTGRNVNRFHVAWEGLACLNDNEARSGGCWDPGKQDAKNKLLTRQIGRYPEFALDEHGYQCLNTMFMINVIEGGPDPQYLLGILNSSLIAALWLDRFYDHRRTFPKIKGEYLKRLPIKRINEADRRERDLHDAIVKVVDVLVAVYEQAAHASVAQEKTALERQAAAAEEQLNRLVFEIYDLSDAEKKAVTKALLAEIS